MKRPIDIGRLNGRIRLPFCPRGLNALLPGEPRIARPELAEALTLRCLTPALAELEVFFLELRAQVDPVLRAAAPVKNGKPYPLGQCLEITLAIQAQLKVIDPGCLSPRAQQGYQALSRFMAARGTLRRVWGDLRGQYFQNAFLMGSLYVDVSNDTVVVTKPKVEILPFNASGLHSIRDYDHFGQIAESYWQVSAWPNHLLPDLAPGFPMLTITREGGVALQESGDYLMALNWQQAFHPAETYLARPPMPEAMFASIARLLRSGPHRLASDPFQGRRLALRTTREYRRKRWHQYAETRQRLLFAGQAVNRTLSRAQAARQSPAPVLAKSLIRIEGSEHSLARLSPEALQQVQALQQIDAEIIRTRNLLAMMETARHAYAQALKGALPVAHPACE